MNILEYSKKRQIIYWRLISTLFEFTDQASNFEVMSTEITKSLGLPQLLLDPSIAIDTILQRYPELEEDFNEKYISSFFKKDQEQTQNDITTLVDLFDTNKSLRQAIVLSKVLMNILGKITQYPVITAQQYNQWLKDVSFFEKMCGFRPGSLAGRKESETQTSDFYDAEVQIKLATSEIEKELVNRMALREILQDNKLAKKLTPSMPLVEHLLRDKANLSGIALRNAKNLIRRYIDQLSEVLKLQVEQTPVGKIDYSTPPKRVFRNLDFNRTLWKNLPNWNTDQKKLYVNQLFFKHTARKTKPTRIIVVVDQSGSMVDAMVQCTILASIFAGLANVDVHLLAFDTKVLDLTTYVQDPFEVLLRTTLGGGTDIHQALIEASRCITEPRNTAIVLISDFYEGGSYQVLFDYIKSIKNSGVHFIPVGSVTSSGYFNVEKWFRARLKELGTPILTGTPKKLIQELKKVIVS